MSRHVLLAVSLALASAGTGWAHGLLIPEDKTLPPLAMLNHKVTIAIEDQVAVTRVEQTFRNHTDRQLEATYIFPVPRNASVNKFTMWVNGKEVSGELVEAAKAREIYTSIVRRTQDPGLLEYMGNNLMRMRVFPIPPKGDQKVALSYTSVAPNESGVIEYVYPLKTEGKATGTLEEFSITATIKSQHAVQNVYSPTHAITLNRKSDQEVNVQFDRNQGMLDKDFLLYYSLGDKDVGVTVLRHRPVVDENGYVLLLISPKVEMSEKYQVPRDMVLVLDTSGSMRGAKLDQAKRALKYCLKNLGEQDRFAVINFATTVNRYRDGLTKTGTDSLEQACKWVDRLESTGGTAINDALSAALELRTTEPGRTFTVVFFTDGQPTIGETNPERIYRNVADRNTASTRVFTFGVGDDVNATLLDRLSEQTRAVATYVRPAEDIEMKVSGLYSKISHPVLANLKLASSDNVRFTEIYPPQLPDLFHGGQVIALARYSGKGHSAIKLTGTVGDETREFVYESEFPERTNESKEFVEHLWARRKVGYLLDQIRANGEKKELVEEVTALAKKYGITTPYTSWLIVPDAPVGTPLAASGRLNSGLGLGGAGIATRPSMGGGGSGGFGGPGGSTVPPGLVPAGPGGKVQSVTEFARQNQAKPGELAGNRGGYLDKTLRKAEAGADAKLNEAAEKKDLYDEARRALAQRQRDRVQAGKMGVDLSVQMNALRNQARLEQTALRNVASRNCIELGGVWIDEGFTEKTPVLVIKAMSDAYFRLLEKHPELKQVYQLGNHLVWITPSGTALVVDTGDGKEKLEDKEIETLFVAKK